MYFYAKKDNKLIIGELESLVKDSVCLSNIYEVTFNNSVLDLLDLKLISENVFPGMDTYDYFLGNEDVELEKIEHKYYPSLDHFDSFIITVRAKHRDVTDTCEAV